MTDMPAGYGFYPRELVADACRRYLADAENRKVLVLAKACREMEGLRHWFGFGAPLTEAEIRARVEDDIEVGIKVSVIRVNAQDVGKLLTLANTSQAKSILVSSNVYPRISTFFFGED